jgi:hypothetical protein
MPRVSESMASILVSRSNPSWGSWARSSRRKRAGSNIGQGRRRRSPGEIGRAKIKCQTHRKRQDHLTSWHPAALLRPRSRKRPTAGRGRGRQQFGLDLFSHQIASDDKITDANIQHNTELGGHGPCRSHAVIQGSRDFPDGRIVLRQPRSLCFSAAVHASNPNSSSKTPPSRGL